MKMLRQIICLGLAALLLVSKGKCLAIATRISHLTLEKRLSWKLNFHTWCGRAKDFSFSDFLWFRKKINNNNFSGKVSTTVLEHDTARHIFTNKNCVQAEILKSFWKFVVDVIIVTMIPILIKMQVTILMISIGSQSNTYALWNKE